MSVISMKSLLEAGVHFGHQTRRWNPKMAPYIFTERNGIYIIDLQKTVKKVEEAYNFVKESVANGDTVLFNFRTIQTRIARLNEIEEMENSGQMALLPKKEQSKLAKEKAELINNFGGIRNMKKIPGIMFVVDPRKEHNAIHEAKKLGIKVIAIVDTNCDPDDADYIIPGNDDAIRAVKLIAGTMANAVIEANQGESMYEGEAEASEAAEAAPEAEAAEAPAEAEAAEAPAEA